MTDIPEDVMKMARLAFAQANRQAWWTNTKEGEAIIARAIIADRAAQAERMARMEEALRRIEKWSGEFPESGNYWPDGTPMSYGACYGSNGERDFMRDIAARALSQEGSEPS